MQPDQVEVRWMHILYMALAGASLCVRLTRDPIEALCGFNLSADISKMIDVMLRVYELPHSGL